MSVMRMEIKLQPQFNSSIYFHFTQKSKQAFYSGLALENLPKKTRPIKPGLKWVFFVFFNFLFFKVFENIYINFQIKKYSQYILRLCLLRTFRNYN